MNSWESPERDGMNTKRKMSVQKEEPRRMLSTLQHNSFSSMSERRCQADLEEQRGAWNFSERKMVAAMEDYLEGFADLSVDIDLEGFADLSVDIELLERTDICLRYILKYVTKRGSSIFQFCDKI